MASTYPNRQAQERAEDRAIMEQGVIITGQRGQDPTHVWRLEPEQEQTHERSHSGYLSSSEEEEGEQYTDRTEFRGPIRHSVTLLHPPTAPRLRMKSGALVADEYKNIHRHPFVVNPNEDPMRLLTPAEDHETATFGGLVIGYHGDKPQGPGSNDYMYRGFLFQPGSNIGPEYPGDLSMSPYCIPKSTRVKQVENDEARRGQMLAHFAPTLSPTFGSRSNASSKILHGLPSPSDGEKGGQESGDETDGAKTDKDLNVFVFFGKPQPIPPIDCPPVFPTSDETVLDYIDEHNLEIFFEHLLSLCVLNFQEQPFEFMAEYCDTLIQARTHLNKFDELARVFYPSHVAAVYRLFDKQQAGWVSLNKYRLGMEVIGLKRYKPDPDGYDIDQIKKETFCDEGCRALEILLRSFMA